MRTAGIRLKGWGGGGGGITNQRPETSSEVLEHQTGRQLTYWGSCVVRRLAKRSVLQFVRKGQITVGSSCQSVESRKVRDSKSAIVFSFPGTCCAEIKTFL